MVGTHPGKMSRKTNVKNPIINELIDLNIIKKKNLIRFSDRTRDKKVKEWQDKKTKVIVLDKNTTSLNYYKNKNELIKKNQKINIKSNNKIFNLHQINDCLRRALKFNKVLKNKTVLDFGCAYGDFLSNLKNSKNLYGIEPRTQCLDYIKKNKKNFNVFSNLNDFKNQIDVITLFHVLEHIPNQVKILNQLKKKLKPNGKIIIEVPHARDVLLQFEKFKNFSLWSEHLILHTDKSLKKILKVAGFKNIKVKYFQRYNINNHMGWIIFNKPNGHVFLNKFHKKSSINKYNSYLIKNKISDTLIATASL